jgi:Glucose-6-phosphate dehydrogenase, C-terminal domain
VFGGSELVDRRLSRGGQPEPPVHGGDQAIPGQPEEVAARLWVDMDRWSGVPFLLRTGKQLAAYRQVVSLVLRQSDAPVPALPAVGDGLAFDLDGDGELDLCSSSTNQTDLMVSTAHAALGIVNLSSFELSMDMWNLGWQPGRSPQRCSGGCRGRARDLVPGAESGAHLASVFLGGEPVAAGPEVQ